MRVIKEKWSRHVVQLFITCETGLSEKMAYLETIIREQSLRQEYQIECKNIFLATSRRLHRLCFTTRDL